MRWILASMLVVLAQPAVAEGVEPWKPAQVSSPQFESHAAFDPRTGDFFFVRSAPNFTGWRILVSHCGDSGWSAPQPPGFAGPGLEADPFLTADGSTLYFISTRASGALDSSALDIWRVSRAPGGGWGSPERLPEPVNSAAAEWYPRLAPDGWLYFGSSRPGGVGGTDIWRARADNDGRWVAENLGPNVNGAGEDYEPLLSPDGATMLLMTDSGYYESRRTEQGWSPRVKLGSEINKNGTEIGALFSPSGNSILFARATKEGGSGEFFLWRRGPAEAWPPECPAGPAGSQGASLQSWFQATEQTLMDAITAGDRGAWERVADESFVLTSEEGEVLNRAQLLEALRPMPAGLAGNIAVVDLSVQPFADFAVVRFRADEWQTVFGQRLETAYRVTDAYRRAGDKWKIVASHLSVITRDPPAQEVSKAAWPSYVGRYRLSPDGWQFTVELRDGTLYGGRDPARLRPFVPVAPNVFVLSGTLGEWIFVSDEAGRVTRIVDLRKFETLVWTRVAEP